MTSTSSPARTAFILRAEIKGGKIVAVEGAETKFVLIIERLGKAVPQRITSAKQLARIMAAKARLMADVIEKALLHIVS